MAQQMIYPDKRVVTDMWVKSQAQDYLATEYMRANPHAEESAIEENARVSTVEQAIEILEDAGLVTFAGGL